MRFKLDFLAVAFRGLLGRRPLRTASEWAREGDAC
jgi:hypothetical protein